MASLTKEIAAYEELRNALEVDHLGKYVVVHDEKLEGVHESFQAAGRRGGAAFRPRPVPDPTSGRRSDRAAGRGALQPGHWLTVRQVECGFPVTLACWFNGDRP